MRNWAIAVVALLAPAIAITSCSSAYTASSMSTNPDASTFGNEGELCLPNGTCNAPFVCVSTTCFAPPDGSNIGESGSSNACPRSFLPDDLTPYVLPNKTEGPGSCNANDIETLSHGLGVAGDPDYYTLYNAITPSCDDCVFSGSTQANWQVIVIVPDLGAGLIADPVNAFVNVGFCYQVASQGGIACGQGAEDYNQCVDLACPKACDSDPGCEEQSRTTSCTSEYEEMMNGCGANYASYKTYCSGADGAGSAIDMIELLCGPVDGG